MFKLLQNKIRTDIPFAYFCTSSILSKKICEILMSRAEDLITTLMGALQQNAAADWNLMLNSEGGPSYILKLDAPIFANENYSAFYKQSMYYVMAHFAKFIIPGSLRIKATSLGFNETKVQTVAYLRPDKKVCVVLANNLDESISLTLVDQLKGETRLTLIPNSINTLIYSVKDFQSDNICQYTHIENIFQDLIKCFSYFWNKAHSFSFSEQ